MFDPTELSRDVKRALAILAVGHLLFVGLAVGGASLDHGRLDATVSVEPAAMQGGNVTAFQVRITNHERAPIHPVVRIHSDGWHIQNAWELRRLRGGTATARRPTVRPGETVVYWVEVPYDAARAAPSPGESAVVIVGNATTQERTIIGPVEVHGGGRGR